MKQARNISEVLMFFFFSLLKGHFEDTVKVQLRQKILHVRQYADLPLAGLGKVLGMQG